MNGIVGFGGRIQVVQDDGRLRMLCPPALQPARNQRAFTQTGFTADQNGSWSLGRHRRIQLGKIVFATNVELTARLAIGLVAHALEGQVVGHFVGRIFFFN